MFLLQPKVVPESPNFLTFDIEEWHHVNYEGVDATGLRSEPEWLEGLVDRLLAMCDEFGVKSTFFILGSVAEEHPEAIKRIAAAGHEIALHSFAHKSVFSMEREDFKEDLLRSRDVLEALTGQKVKGFRAPSFSVTREVLPWFYEELEKAGLEYSSSVFPGKTFLYGIPDFPRVPHRPLVEGRRSAITEFPMTRVDFAGKTLGLYVRMFPASFLRRSIRAENASGRPAMLYLHPREIDPEQPRLALPWPASFIHYFGVRGCERKLRTVLETAPRRFLRIADTLPDYSGN